MAGRDADDVVRPRPHPAQAVAVEPVRRRAAGNAVVTVARVGRLVGRSYVRMAKQLPGVSALEAQAQRVRQAAADELIRLLEMPQYLTGGAGPEEHRVMTLIHSVGSDPEPLRSAMSELLERSSAVGGDRSREYLFGTIVSQLVPDEARVLGALAGGRRFAALDVVHRPNGRSGRRQVVLANASTIGSAAGIGSPADVSVYLGRLQGFGLLDFTYSPTGLDAQFESLLRDPEVSAVRAKVEAARQGNATIVRKAVTLSALGREFWAACAPSRTRRARRTS